MIEKVTHTLSRSQYAQSFSLRRNALSERSAAGADSLALVVDYDVLQASIHYRLDDTGTLARWKLDYTSTPVLPVKSFRLNKLSPFAKAGTVQDREITLTGTAGTSPQRMTSRAPLTSLYTLVERLSHTTRRVLS